MVAVFALVGSLLPLSVAGDPIGDDGRSPSEPTGEFADLPAAATNPLPPEADRRRGQQKPQSATVDDLTELWDTSSRVGPTYSATAQRLGGANRYEVAVAIAKRGFPRGASVVYLARSDVLTDALVAGTLRDGPILLTQTNALPAVINAEITRLGNPKVVVIGSAGSVSDATAKAASRGRPYTRLAGPDRISTSVAVARYAFPQGAQHAYLAHGFGAGGQGSPDAVSAGGVSDGPILWVNPRRGLEPATARLLSDLGVTQRHQLGWVDLNVPVTDRIGSFDRYTASVAIAEHTFGLSPVTVYLARGDVFSDAAAAGSLNDGPVLLVQPTTLPRAVCTYLRRSVPVNVIALGSTASVSATVLNQARACASRGTYKLFSGYTFHEVDSMPYVGPGTVPMRTDCVNDTDPSYGIHTRAWDGVNVFHPVSLAGQTLGSISRYAKQPTTAEGCRQLNIARNNAMYFLQSPNRHTVGEADFYAYDFPVLIGGVPQKYIPAPWYSGMGQGHMLSVFSRLYQIDRNPVWLEAARRTFNSFTVPRIQGRPWVTIEDGNGRIWFEEYAGDVAAPLVINGQVFAIFGMYDYYKASGDPRARITMDAGATTMLDAYPEYRDPGARSFYCAENPHCQSARWRASVHYHTVVIDQLEVLAQMTGDRRFSMAAAALRADG